MPAGMDNSSASGEASVSSGNQVAAPLALPAPKKKRNLPGTPDPDAEVIALSPGTLMATNRFVCEICGKGFQRDQNLQLHRRGHNLPWKLRQRTDKEAARKRVYVCPEPSCVHHDPARALGDLTGIKKHFCRKHGEKRWKCDKCSKRYAVQSDWKAHGKTCGTREYRCDCGTLFSRRDSFITHRAFCDALAEESAKTTTQQQALPANPSADADADEPTPEEEGKEVLLLPPPPPPPEQPPETREPEIPSAALQYIPQPAVAAAAGVYSGSVTASSGGGSAGLFASLFASTAASSASAAPPTHGSSFSDLIGTLNCGGAPAMEPPSLCLSSKVPAAPAFSQYLPPPPPPPAPATPHLSATALLQKAAQMGASATNASSLLRGFGLAPSSFSGQDDSPHAQDATSLPWRRHGGQQQQSIMEQEPPAMSASLGLGLPYESRAAAAGLQELMMGSSALFSGKPAATLDLLGLGIGPSALINSIGGAGAGAGLDMGVNQGAAFGGGGSPGRRA